MIKVLHSELQANIGGIESFLLNLTKSIDMSNIHFDMLMRGNNQFLEDELKKLGVTIYKVPTNPIQYYRFVKNLLKTNNYDFVHVHKNSAANIVLPLMVKKYSNAKLIIHSHNTNPSNGSKLGILLHKINQKKIIRLSDYRFACSDKAAIWMFGRNYSKLKVHIIKNGILASKYDFNSKIRNSVRKNLNVENNFVIGNVGAFRKQKNHQYLIKLFSQLDIPNKKLILVGVGPLEQQMKQLARDLKIQDQVLFLGKREDVPNILQAMDVLVMPSLWEGLSVSAIEAQASGLPLLLSDNVSQLTKLTNNVKFLSLKDVSIWKKYLQNIDNSFVRKSELTSIISQGYDIANSAQILAKFYNTEK